MKGEVISKSSTSLKKFWQLGRGKVLDSLKSTQKLPGFRTESQVPQQLEELIAMLDERK